MEEQPPSEEEGGHGTMAAAGRGGGGAVQRAHAGGRLGTWGGSTLHPDTARAPNGNSLAHHVLRRVGLPRCSDGGGGGTVSGVRSPPVKRAAARRGHARRPRRRLHAARGRASLATPTSQLAKMARTSVGPNAWCTWQGEGGSRGRRGGWRHAAARQPGACAVRQGKRAPLPFHLALPRAARPAPRCAPSSAPAAPRTTCAPQTCPSRCRGR